MRLEKISDGNWNYVKKPRIVESNYENFLIQSLNAFDNLFVEAKISSEFEFILTLLGVRGLEDAGWNPFETTKYVFELFSDLLNKKRSFKESIHYSLLLYCHLIEASEPYEIICNMINIANGGRYNINNFPAKGEKQIPQFPIEKITKLNKLIQNEKQKKVIELLETFYDRELRNAIFHSDYSVYGSELRLRNPIKVFSHSQIMKIINHCIAYYNSFINIVEHNISVYDSPKEIDVHPEFARYPDEKAIAIVREGYGLVGLKDNLNDKELKSGRITFRVGKFLSYEGKMLDKDHSLNKLPKNKIEQINKYLKFLPSFMRRKFVKIISPKYL